MNILIVGEFSGVAKNLSIGFEKLGIRAEIISDGDGYKNISNKKPNFIERTVLWRWSGQVIQAIKKINKSYDFIIFLSPFVFKYPLFLNNKLYENLIMRSKKTILVSCTSDSIWWRNYDSMKGRSPHLGSIQDTNGKTHRYATNKYYKSNLNFVEVIDKVIALAPEYKFAYESLGIDVPWVPFPYETSNNKQTPISRNLIYHGITREGFKGTSKIKNIMKDIDLGLDQLITKQISYENFVANLQKTVIYFDQAYSHAPAMSALTALENVPFVVTGVQPNKHNLSYFSECPAIDILEDVTKIEEMVSNTKNLEEQIEKNRLFIQKYHNPTNICRKILET